MSPSADASTGTGTTTGQRSDPTALHSGPDDAFALVTGLYVAVVLVPLVLAWLASTVSDAATLSLTALGGGTAVVAAVTLGVRRVQGVDYRLGATSTRWGLLLLPLLAAAIVGGARVALVPTATPNSVALFGLAAVAGGVLLGTILVTMARTRYAKAIEAGVETAVEWRAAWPATRRRAPKLAGGLAVAFGVGAFTLGSLVEGAPTAALGNLLLPLGIVLFMFGHNARTYRANSAGLVRQMPAHRELYDWDRFDGFAVADDAIVVHFRAPWRFPVVCDREELDDKDAVVAALSAHLPRLPAR